MHSAQFVVSTPNEFQKALSTAASNGSDDTILLNAGVYSGGAFVFITDENNTSLTIKANDVYYRNRQRWRSKNQQ